MTDATPDPPAMTRAQMRAAELAAGPAIVPVPEMRLQPLVTIAVIALAGLLTISAFAGPVLVAVAVALAAGVMAWGWSGLLGLPSPRGTAFVLAVGSAGAIGTALATRDDPFLAWMPAALAGSMIVAFLHQLARRDGRPRLVESIASTITAIAIVVSGASLVVLPRTPHGAWVVALAASAMAVSALTDLVGGMPRLRAWLLPLAMLAGGVVAIAVGLGVWRRRLGAGRPPGGAGGRGQPRRSSRAGHVAGDQRLALAAGERLRLGADRRRGGLRRGPAVRHPEP